MSDTTWTYLDENGAAQGPVSLSRVVELVRQGLLGELSRVRTGAETDWSLLRDRLPELFSAPPAALRKGAWRDAKPHPWRRYFARSLDNLVVGGLTWGLVGLVLGAFAPAVADSLFTVFRQPYGMVLDALATCVVVIPGNALMIGLTGLSIGKWVFGIKVTTRAGKPIGFGRALVREVRIWVTGLGLGIPFVSLIALLLSAVRLSSDGATGYDKDQRNLVVHRTAGWVQTLLSILGVVVIVAIQVILRLGQFQNALK